MSKSDPTANSPGAASERPVRTPGRRAVALRYGVNDSAPVVVASGMGYLAEKILDVAQESGVPVYEDNSLATILSQLNLGQEIPEELYRAVVEIYVYFLNFDLQRAAAQQHAATAEEPAAAQEPLPSGDDAGEESL